MRPSFAKPKATEQGYLSGSQKHTASPLVL